MIEQQYEEDWQFFDLVAQVKFAKEEFYNDDKGNKHWRGYLKGYRRTLVLAAGFDMDKESQIGTGFYTEKFKRKLDKLAQAQ